MVKSFSLAQAIRAPYCNSFLTHRDVEFGGKLLTLLVLQLAEPDVTIVADRAPAAAASRTT
ncbi:hypothetical protein XH81_30050 [Bradyrhizobium sp. CCBAU 25360]|nr:hypothetical protein [Bradyrhizobium sp. CCBAU 25360]